LHAMLTMVQFYNNFKNENTDRMGFN
jgi:hypothetical protein